MDQTHSAHFISGGINVVVRDLRIFSSKDHYNTGSGGYSMRRLGAAAPGTLKWCEYSNVKMLVWREDYADSSHIYVNEKTWDGHSLIGQDYDNTVVPAVSYLLEPNHGDHLALLSTAPSA
jgi:hypothetical protein